MRFTLATIACALALTGVACTTTATHEASSRPESTTPPTIALSRLPVSPFLPPSVVVRGSLEMIGYMTSPGPDGGLVATVYLWAPEVTSKAPEDDPGASPPCELAPRVTGAGTDHVVVDVDLVWTPNTSKSVLMNGDCRADGGKHPVRRSYVVGPVSSSARLFTSKPEADTPLPRLAEPPG
ncbi:MULTISPECIES: hypothetical protein [unclassified Mycobacterium]|uniref:hypothetical protein n=1 Tax=unclassified Mycobacterium TaxID=2642494 RepID=UPI0029C7BBFD|nr:MULTISPECIES: hypothetical protein [unclassified Mycobacterium]